MVLQRLKKVQMEWLHQLQNWSERWGDLNCTCLTPCCGLCVGLHLGNLVCEWWSYSSANKGIFLFAFIFHFLYILCMKAWHLWQKITAPVPHILTFLFFIGCPWWHSHFWIWSSAWGWRTSLSPCECQAGLRWEGSPGLQQTAKALSVLQTGSSSLRSR